MLAQLMPSLIQQFLDNNGVALALGTITTYQAGTTTPQATFIDQTGGTPNANPLTLDANGMAQIWLSNAAYKFVVKNASGTTIRTIDNVSWINPGTVINSMLANMAQSTIKGRAVDTGTGSPVDLSAAQATAILNPFTGDTGTGGVQGVVPAPTAGQAAQNSYLAADGTFKYIQGNVVSTATDYAMTGYEDVVVVTAACMITLFDASQTANNGREVSIIHQAAQFAVITISMVNPQTIYYRGASYTSGMITLCTSGEVIRVRQINSTTFVITEHDCETGWIADTTAILQWYHFIVTGGSVTIGATYTDGLNTFTVCRTNTVLQTDLYCSLTANVGSIPASGTLTKVSGTGISSFTYTSVSGANNPIATTTNPSFSQGSAAQNSMQWRRRQNYATLCLNVYDSSQGPASGSGDYIWNIPSGLVIDTTLAPLYVLATAQGSQVGIPAQNQYRISMIGSADASAFGQWQAQFAIPYTSTSFIAYGNYSASGELYFFVVNANATRTATYTDSGSNAYTVLNSITSGTTAILMCIGSAGITPSGALTKAGGSGDSTITIISVNAVTQGANSVALGSSYIPSGLIVAYNFQVTFPIAGWLP